MYWDEDLLRSVDAALAGASTGTPTTLVVEGDAGTGKSSLLAEIAHRAAGFVHLGTDAYETAAPRPYDVLSGIGVEAVDAATGRPLSPVLAGQRLRELIDRHGADAPVLLVVDDLQWADAESVDALVALMSRAAGDRLLLCVGSRPLEPGQLAGWRRWASRPGRVERVVLSGLSRDDAVALVRELAPSIGADVAVRLWEHTSGNPLYLRALVADFDASDLTAMRVLPAPAEYAHSITTRLDALSSSARDLAWALAVLSSGWTSTLDLAAVAGVAEPSRALSELVEAALVDSRATDADDRVRPAHKLVEAAIYQSIPVDARRALHARAAQVVTGVAAALEHRAAAVERYDDELAADLAAYAARLHEQRSFRLAAHYLRAASAVTADPAERERRWLDSLFDMMMSGGQHDRDPVRAVRAQIDQASDVRRRDLLLGYLALGERRPIDAVVIFSRWSGWEVDDVVQYRIEALLSWSLICSGAPESAVRAAIESAARCSVTDSAVSRLAMIAAGQLASRHAADPIALVAQLDLPDAAAAVAPEATSRLAWRGLVRANSGQFAAAAADLVEVTDRMQRGLQEFSAGTFHATLARVQWFRGDWALARINFRLADQLSEDYPHPVVAALLPLLSIGEGDFEAADRRLEVAHGLLAHGPWPEAIDQLTIAEVIRAHADARSPSAYAAIKPAVADARAGTIAKSVLWKAHAGLAAIWAGELGDARACADMIETAAPWAAWTPPVGAWLRGLAAEAMGDGKAALAQLRKATGADMSTMVLYGAHIHLDHARVAHLMGDTSAAARSLEVAAGTYQALGAAPYLARINEIRRTTTATRRAASLALSDRERDVLTLVTAGMSYAQIARDLFITQSTVSYHLGNIYAKANVSSRHQLTALVRAEPTAFGLGMS